MNKFWNWVVHENTDARELRLEGAIASETWFEDEVSPKMFRDELEQGSGPITLWLNSPGGDCVAASQIYAMLVDYPGEVTVIIDGMAASAASVIAMAGAKVIMAPTAIMMVHNPLTCVFGDRADMRQAIKMLDEIKESIINAYEIKTGLSRDRLSKLMDEETWMSANKALELGFCDEVMTGKVDEQTFEQGASFAFKRLTAVNSLIEKIKAKDIRESEPVEQPDNRVSINELYNRLEKIKY